MRARPLKVLQILVTQPYPIPTEAIASKFQVSPRTIRNDLQEINEYLSTMNLPLVNTLRGKGLELSLSESERNLVLQSIYTVEIDYYSNSELRLLNLLLEFSLGNIQYIYEKQEEFQVSKSTIDNDIRKVREVLSEYNLSLDTKESGKISIEGSERAIRILLFNTINKMVGHVDIYDTAKNQSPKYQILFQYLPRHLFEKMTALYEEYLVFDDVMYKNQTILFLSIWVTRLQQGNILAGSYSTETMNQDAIEEFIERIEKENDLLLNHSEREYVRLILETLVSDTIDDTSEWIEGQIVTLELIHHVEKEMGLRLNKQEELFSGLFKHLVRLRNRLENNLQISNPLTEEIKENNPEIFQTIKQFNFFVSEDYQITDNEIAFICIYFLVSISQFRQNFDYVYRAVVFCNHGKATGKLLAQMLEENFKIDVVAVLSSSELALTQKLDVDIAFSTIHMEIEAVPVLVVDSLLMKENYRKVAEFLKRHENRRNQVYRETLTIEKSSEFFEDILQLIMKSKGEVNQAVYLGLKQLFKKNRLTIDDEMTLPTMQDISKDEHIVYNLKADNWEEGIRKTGELLVEHQYVTEEYVEAMVEAVQTNGPYIVMAPHVALAHARPEDGVHQLGVSVSFLEEPVAFGHRRNDPVRVIFCIAPVDSYTHMNIMKNIFEVINDEKLIRKILNSEDKVSFIKNLLSLN